MSTTGRVIVVHGGAGSGAEQAGGCRRAAEVGLAVLQPGGSAISAAVAAVTSMEDDGGFNAGAGSVLRLDGATIEMDAAAMDSDSLLGAVAAVRATRNPVKLARAVASSPHVLLAGDGADLLARKLGLPPHPGPSPRALERHRRLVQSLQAGNASGAWDLTAVETWWNFPSAALSGHDTVGAIVRDGSGVFAVATSTGGSVPMLRGRVGDTPLVGCGFLAGRHGAVAATGEGEQIVRRLGSLMVYQELAAGKGAQEACDSALSQFPKDILVGFIAVGPSSVGMACSRGMAWLALGE